MYFLQISDSHHLISYDKTGDSFQDAFLHLHKFNDKMEKLKEKITKPLDFICHCGDVTHGGEVKDYRAVAECLEACFPQVPVFAVAGNHDDSALVQGVFAPEQGDFPHRCDQIAGLQVLSLDNTGGYRGKITQEACQWLLDKLGNGEDSILLCHHHLLSQQNVMPSAKKDPLFQAVLEQGNLKAILTGHTHYAYAGKVGEIPYYTVDSLCFHGKDSGKGYLDLTESSGYQVFSYENGMITLEEKGQLGFSDYLGKVTL